MKNDDIKYLDDIGDFLNGILQFNNKYDHILIEEYKKYLDERVFLDKQLEYYAKYLLSFINSPIIISLQRKAKLKIIKKCNEICTNN
jgi:hypothetical protein